jgi:predicted RNase H-like nuclease
VSLSWQAYGILPKIRDVDRLVTPELQATFREMHPEVAFCVVNRGPLVHRKKTADGQQERLAIPRHHGVMFDPVRERQRLGASRVAIDDVIDAAVGVVTASRIAAGHESVLGGSRDARGLRMEIVS